MSETPETGAPDGSLPEWSTPPLDDLEAEESDASPEAPDKLRAACEAWLERRGIDPASLPRLAMSRREFQLFTNVALPGAHHVASARSAYNIPEGEEVVRVEIEGEGSVLVDVTEAEFGTALDRSDADPATVTTIPPMSRREFNLFRNVGIGGSHLVYSTREDYKIKVPSDDQTDHQYAWVQIDGEGTVLVDVAEADFGMVIDREVIENDFQDPDPDNPLTPDSGGAFATVNPEEFANTVAVSVHGIQLFAKALMDQKTTNPFDTYDGDIGVRAGALMPGQKDAFVWTTTRITRSVELTIAFPGQYDSVCIVRGQRREGGPINGKAGMDQIQNPTVVLKIEGDNLTALQKIYRELYHAPNFALSDEQRRQRDQTFNDYVESEIIRQASQNRTDQQTRLDDEYRRRHQPPKLRERRLPYN